MSELESEGPVVVDFWAEWCTPCKHMAPAFESVSRKLPHVTFMKINIDEHKDLADHHGVRSVPTCVVLHKGKEITRITGALPEPLLHQKIIDALKQIEEVH